MEDTTAVAAALEREGAITRAVLAASGFEVTDTLLVPEGHEPFLRLEYRSPRDLLHTVRVSRSTVVAERFAVTHASALGPVGPGYPSRTLDPTATAHGAWRRDSLVASNEALRRVLRLYAPRPPYEEWLSSVDTLVDALAGSVSEADALDAASLLALEEPDGRAGVAVALGIIDDLVFGAPIEWALRRATGRS